VLAIFFLKEFDMKIFVVLALATAFVANTAEAGCRGGLLGGKLRGGNSSCGTSCGTSCGLSGGRIIQSKSSCSSGRCASSCTSANPVKKEEAKGAEKPKATAPSTK
jgi:hypothetical protein